MFKNISLDGIYPKASKDIIDEEELYVFIKKQL